MWEHPSHGTLRTDVPIARPLWSREAMPSLHEVVPRYVGDANTLTAAALRARRCHPAYAARIQPDAADGTLAPSSPIPTLDSSSSAFVFPSVPRSTIMVRPGVGRAAGRSEPKPQPAPPAASRAPERPPLPATSTPTVRRQPGGRDLSRSPEEHPSPGTNDIPRSAGAALPTYR